MSKIRILHLITRLPVGGAERLLLGVLSRLDPQRYESTVCCIQDRGELAGEVEAMGIRLVALNLMDKGGFDRRVTPTLVELIHRERIELVHSHLYHANLYGRLAAFRAGVPIIASVHNTYTKRKWYRHLLNRWLGKRTARVIAGSAEVREDIRRHDHIDDSKIVVMPNCIDLERVRTDLNREQARRRLGCADDDFVLGTVGRLEEQKGHIHLLQAMSILRDTGLGKRLRLFIIGDGRRRGELEAAASDLAIAGQVSFLGTQTRTADFLRAFDLFVMPSLWEGLSLAMLEAMAAGLPILATDVGGASEVLGNNQFGIRVPPGNADAIARQIAELAGNPLRLSRLAEAARERAESNYSTTTLAHRLEALYAEVIAESGGKR